MPTTKERFEAFVRREPSGCHVWTGSVAWNGYGRFGLDGRMHNAHRVAYLLAHGAVPRGLVVDHLCRNRVCVNPEHLEAVTQSENCRRGLSGRHENHARGVRQHLAKMTEASVREVRKKAGGGQSFRSLASEYGIDKSVVSDIVNRRTWRHVNGEH